MDTTPPTQPENVAPAPIGLAAPMEKQNLPLAIACGLVAAIVGAVIWATVTVTTEYQIGWMAIGVGFLVGFAVRLGKGTTALFGGVGAILSLFGCLLGNFFALIGFVAKNQHTDVFSTLSSIDYAKVPDIMGSTFSAMDLVFYGIAVYEGYRFSLHRPAASPVANK
jgi:hypothetical protein